MIATRIQTRLPAVAASVTALLLAGAACARARPVKLVPEAVFTSGLASPRGIAVSPEGDIYLGEDNAQRVQELGPAGEFVSMFGKEVDQTTKGDICTAASKDVCGPGVQGTGAGAFAYPISMAIDQNAPHSVYVQDWLNWRVDEYTTAGEFVLTFGKEVNATKVAAIKAKGGAPSQSEIEEENICTAQEVQVSGVQCKAGAQSASASTEHKAFKFAFGNVLAVGGPGDLLYVGDEQRVQEFDAQGEWKGEIALPASAPGDDVQALAVDNIGDVYVVDHGSSDGATNVVREFEPGGKEVKDEHFPLALSPRAREGEVSADVGIDAIALDSVGALDPDGLLAIMGVEKANFPGNVSYFEKRGMLYDARTAARITNFSWPGFNPGGIVFHGEAKLYAVEAIPPEVITYKPVNVAELAVTEASCNEGPEHETDVTENCSLGGSVNPWGVTQTEVWFEWGRAKALGEKTAVQVVKEPPGEVALPISAEIAGVRPNEAAYYQLAGYDKNAPPSESEPLTSEVIKPFRTQLAAPRIVGDPSAPFVRPSSVVMFGELNPENARTEYSFEYGPGQALIDCPGGMRTERAHCEAEGVASTSVQEAPCPEFQAEVFRCVYGKIGVTAEARNLRAGTTYHFRLVAQSESRQKTETTGAKGSEGAFTTEPAQLPQATTGGHSTPGTTSATISGMVNPDGQPATYEFELGVYDGAATQYGVVSSGPAGTSSVPVEESLTLTGLQPGTTYAYRISARGGYSTAYGAPEMFTTSGLPSALVVPSSLVMLPTPEGVTFPRELAGVTTKKLTNARKLANALKTCKKKRGKRRANCERMARRKFGARSTKKKNR